MINMPRADMLTVLRKLGLTTNLKLCLDAGHETSLPAASTKWIDLSGNSPNNFALGDSTGAEGKDPTINGTAGRRSSSEYLSFDGGDNLEYEGTNPTWMENVHKNNAKFSIMAWVYLTSIDTTQCIIANNGIGSNVVGFTFHVSTASVMRMYVSKEAAPNVLAVLATANPVINAWNFLSVSVDEAAGSNGSFFFTNGTVDLFDATYASPTTGSGGLQLDIGSSGNSTFYLASGSRLASVVMHEGEALSSDKIRAYYQATRGKFGV